MAEPREKISRRELLAGGARGAGLLALGGVAGLLAGRTRGENLVWQIDPEKCTYCGKCQTSCVLTPSAVKCVHAFAMCGYCDFCSGFFTYRPEDRDAAVEGQQCPTGAITRTFINKEPYYQYTIDESLCIACGKCVAGCFQQGNGSLYLQVRHDRCVNCNQCAIAADCPSNAFKRVPASQPYLLKGRGGGK